MTHESQTLREIAAEHHRSLDNVKGWTKHEKWPASDGVRRVGHVDAKTYPRDAVRTFVAHHTRAPRKPLTDVQATAMLAAIPPPARDAGPDWVGVEEIAGRRRIGARAVRKQIAQYPPGSADPYPGANDTGLRHWPTVLAWHKRHAKAGRPTGSTGRATRPPSRRQVNLDRAREVQRHYNQQGRELDANTLGRELGMPSATARRLLTKLTETALL